MILNKNSDSIPDDAIYIGRGSKWGNPFRVNIDGSRTEVILKYEKWLKEHPELIDSIDELRDHPLVCFCKPKACHGDVLMKILTMTPEQRNLWMNGDLNRNNFLEADNEF